MSVATIVDSARTERVCPFVNESFVCSFVCLFHLFVYWSVCLCISQEPNQNSYEFLCCSNGYFIVTYFQSHIDIPRVLDDSKFKIHL